MIVSVNLSPRQERLRLRQGLKKTDFFVSGPRIFQRFDVLFAPVFLPNDVMAFDI
jgi:hypothetical protein